MIVVRVESIEHQPAIEYAWRSLLSAFGRVRVVSYDAGPTPGDAAISFSYGQELPPKRAKRHIHVHATKRFWSNYLQSTSLPMGRPAYLELEPIAVDEIKSPDGVPVIYGPPDGQIWVRIRRDDVGRVLETNADVVASTFFLLTRYEDILNQSANENGFAGREPGWLDRHGLADRPVVDEYRRLLEAWTASLGYRVEPQGERFSIFLTHDIDWLIKHRTWGLSAKAVGLRALVYRRVGQALREAVEAAQVRLRRGDDPYFEAVEWLMGVSNRYGWISHFFFMAGGASRHDAFYPIDHPLARLACERIVASGHRIGLHPSYGSYTDPQIIRAEKKTLERICGRRISGGRQHFLRFKAPDTWRHYAEAGLAYDSSLGYSGDCGFRCGTCRPFVAFDAVQKQLIPIVEYPLIVMDVCITRRADWSAERMAEQIIRYARIVRGFSGVVTVLWHNSESWPTARKAYELAMDEIAEMRPVSIDAGSDSKSRLHAWDLLGTDLQEESI